jgi:hypothetical protein
MEAASCQAVPAGGESWLSAHRQLATVAMSIDTQQVVSSAWNFAHVLRDDGLSYVV